MPSVAADDHGAIARRVKVFFERGKCGLEDLLFEVLSFAIAGVEFAGDAAGFVRVLGQKKTERGFGRMEASGGIEAGSEAEADFGGGDGRHDGGDFHEGAQTFPFGLAEAGESVAHYDTVLAAKGGEVADGAHGGEVEEVAQVWIAASGHFLDAVAEFENEGGGAEVGVAAEGLGVDQCGAGGGAVFGLVMVDDNEVDAAGGEPGGLFVRASAAVEGDDERGLVFGENAVESVAAQSVAFGFAERQEPSGLESKRGEEAVEDGEGCDAIDDIVTIEHNIFASFDGEGDAAGGIDHARGVERIGQGGEAGVEELIGLAGVGDTAGDEE